MSPEVVLLYGRADGPEDADADNAGVLPGPEPERASSPPLARIDLVLDTNVVLDWLAFRHPIGGPLGAALTSGRCRWLCTGVMRDELARVLARESLARWAIDAQAVLAVFDALGVDAGAPEPLGAAERLRCTDPDDQVFIDLAIARRVQALLTRDRALLRLAPRARRLGVLVATPETWLRSRASGHAVFPYGR